MTRMHCQSGERLTRLYQVQGRIGNYIEELKHLIKHLTVLASLVGASLSLCLISLGSEYQL